ncbi:ferric reductase-like, putative [Bodo saltans]|uniref:Ferric reductase-like, putative n=1 Tax=Bodo saltans TaxID=75058 RepID=A0A0S4IY83_BODSA|nr:ferric reductase-like, putative [Bodo saltans]|eukprot:CUG07027.1 ferric reductase-like, putative [Bodo saltans]
MTIAHTNAGMASVGTFGVVSSDMEGSMISCYYGTELDGRSATCFDVDGSNYDIARSSVNYTVLLSAVSNATHATMSFVAPASRFQHLSNSCLISYCWTPYDADAHLPHEHSSGADHGTVSVNFVSGIVMEEVNPYANRFTGYTIVLGIMLIALMIAVLCVRVGGFQPGPTRLATLRVAVPMLLLAMIFTVFEYAVKDFSLKIKPRFRALGEASAFILSLIMIPTTKHVGLGVILGSSYERMLFLHPFLGATLMFTMTVHMGGMFKTFETPTDLFQNTQNVYGFVAWIFMLCVALPAMTIRRQGYHVFRATHCLFVLVLLFAILHHTELVIMMIPAVLLWIVDIALRIRSAASANARIERMCYDTKTRVLTLELSVKGFASIPCAAGSYIFLLVPSISPIMHPFSVALLSAAGTTNNATNWKDGTPGKMNNDACATIL